MAAAWPAEFTANVIDSWPVANLVRVGATHHINDLAVALIDDPREFKTWLGLCPRPDYKCYELLAPYGQPHPIYRRIVLVFGYLGDAPPIDTLEKAALRLRSAFAPNARCTAHAMVTAVVDQDEHRLYLVCDKLCCSGSRTVKVLGLYLAEQFIGLTFVNDWAGSHMVLPNSRNVSVLGTRRLDDATVVANATGLDLVQRCAAVVKTADAKEAGQVCDVSNRRQPWSEQLKRFCDRLDTNARVRDPNELSHLNDERDRYCDRLDASRTGRIDLGNVSPDQHVRLFELRGQAAKLRRAIELDEGDFLFTDARAILDAVFACSPTKEQLWYKYIDEHGRVQLGDNGKKLAKDFFSSLGLYHTLNYPTDDPQLEEILRRQLIGKNHASAKNPPTTFDWFDWYLEFGMRREQGVTFVPLEFGRHRLTEMPGYINQWRGFGAHDFIASPEVRHELHQRFEEYGPVRLIREDTDFGFLLRHFSYMLGEKPEDVLLDVMTDGGMQHATGQFFGWLANMVFFTVQKKPRFYIFQSAPGCGKSLTFGELGKRLLHHSHYMAYTDVKRLQDEFNGHAGLNVMALLEEVDLNDMKARGLRMMQELVSCGERYQRLLYKEGGMVKDFRYFIVCTNVERPIILPPGQRRAVLARFYHEQALRLENREYREEYTRRLAAVLASDQVWKYMAFFLHRTYDTPAGRQKVANSCYSTRVFNHATLQLQFEGLSQTADTSVLGWLYKHLVNFDDFFDGEGDQVYVWKPSDNSKKDINDWMPLKGFSKETRTDFTGRWRDTGGVDYATRCASRRRRTADWWTRNQMEHFYERYKRCTPLGAQLPLREFVDVCKHVFQSKHADMDNDNKVYMYEATAKVNGRTVEMWALAPLAELEDAFKAAMPNTGELNWDEYRRKREEVRVRFVKPIVVPGRGGVVSVQ